MQHALKANRRSHIRFLLLPLVLLALCGCDEDKVTIRITPDGPVHTLEQARYAVRTVKKHFASEGRKVPAIEVVFEDGVYRCDKALELGAEDSGTPESPIVWKAAHKGGAIFNAAVALDWQRETDPAVLALLPAEARDKVLVATIPGTKPIPPFSCNTNGGKVELPPALFAGDERLPRARWPNDTYARTGVVYAEKDVGVNNLAKKDGAFVLKRPGRLAVWMKEPEPWLWGTWGVEWAESIIPLQAKDVSTDLIFVPLSAIPFGLRRAMPFYAFNMFCELDRPGEWVVERGKRRVHVWPAASGKPAELVISDGFIVAKNLKDVVFVGLVFERCRQKALSFTDSERITVRASEIRHTCSWGIWLDGCKDCRVAGCDLYDLGEGGIHMRGGKQKTLTPGNNVADNNHVHHYGRIVHNYREGITAYGVGNRVTHNLVHHSDHTGIYFAGNDHYVGYNVVHDVCEFNDDAGAIYCWQNSWTKRGGIVEHNVIHMVGKKRFPRNTEGIYLDDYTSEVIVRGNIVNRASRGVFMGGGQSHHVYGNVLMNCSGWSILLGSRQGFTAVKQGADSYLWKEIDQHLDTYNSPLWRTRYPGLARLLDWPDRATANHGFWNVFTNNLAVACKEIKLREGAVVEKCTTLADNVAITNNPGFRDYAGFDWTAAPDSPCAALINGCHYDEAGLYPSEERFSPPVKFGEGVSPAVAFGEKTAGPPSVNLAINLATKLPTNVTAFAEKTVNCAVPGWSHGNWIFASVNCDPDPNAPWEDFSYSFVPTHDCKVRLVLMGAESSALTLYDGIRVSGASFKGELFKLPQPIAASEWCRQASTEVACRKGERVTISYRAKAAMPQ